MNRNVRAALIGLVSAGVAYPLITSSAPFIMCWWLTRQSPHDPSIGDSCAWASIYLEPLVRLVAAAVALAVSITAFFVARRRTPRVPALDKPVP